jgi:prepilin-type N-terminal cleavage/methylation domain-containing protein
MKNRAAFTLIELVMVIVVFGIVASIGADIVANLYTNYLRTRAINRLQSQTEITLEQIAKRLQYRIKDSVRVTIDDGATWRALPNAVQTTDGDHTIIEWIGISNESFLGVHDGISVVPGWSGLIDMESNTTKRANLTLDTPGSRLDFANDIIKALTNNRVSMDGSGVHMPGLIFKGAKPGTFANYYPPNPNYEINVTCQANDCNNNPTTLRVPNGLTDFDGDTFGDLFEQYYLSHTAYAILPDSGSATDFTLYLQYNYQPWNGDTYQNASQTILAEHVSTFRIMQTGDTIRIKLCIHDNNQSGNFDFSACKEKVIY